MLCSTLEDILNDGAEVYSSHLRLSSNTNLIQETCRLKGLASLEDFTAVYRSQMILMFEWVEKLKEFQMIRNAHDKAKLLRTFAMKYLLLDNLFYTCEMGFTDRLLFINNTYVQAQLYHASDNADQDHPNKSMSM